MADDIYLSPEEQDEKARQWFKDNGPALAIGIALGLAAIVGYNKYKENLQVNAEQASSLFQQTVAEINDSALSNIDEQVNTLKSDHSGTVYASKAVLVKAKQTAVNDLAAAFNELQWVVDNSPENGLQHTARIRQAKIKLALNEMGVAKKLASYTPTQGFESHYQEILGDIALKEGDEVKARAYYQSAVDALDGQQDNYVQVLSLKIDRLPVPETSDNQSGSTVPVTESDSNTESD
ncbi:hypothetical protein NBRC116583_20830 [Arenicella sp. 4NH20-0111]|uniref:YfgM family protein n=1 Tax=Arenicella sp. 4NH20-0111 TaxID=3127648 RepID=UPI00310712DB